MKGKRHLVWFGLVWGLALAQFPPGPQPPFQQPMPPFQQPTPPFQSQQGRVYQNPALGMSFPIPPGFQLVQEMPLEGGLVAMFMSQAMAELYAIAYPLNPPTDLQGFHQMNLQRLAQLDQQLAQQGIRVQRQPLANLTLGGKPALGVYSQISVQGQNFVGVAVYTVEGGWAFGLQMTAPAQVFPQVQGAYQSLLQQVRIQRPTQQQQGFPNPFPPQPSPLPPSPFPPNPFPPSPGPGGGQESTPPSLGQVFPPPPVAPSPPQSPQLAPSSVKPAFTPPSDRVVQLVYGKEVGDGRRFAVVLGGLRYRIVPKGPGLWEVTEVIEDQDGKGENTYVLDGLGLQEGEDELIPPVWHTGRTEIAGITLQRSQQGDLTLYRYEDREMRLEIAYRRDGWMGYYVYCDLSKKTNPCVRYTLKEVW